MITSMHIENFKCFKDFKIDLAPFNVLIGPNDSGKTAFLQAMKFVGLIESCPMSHQTTTNKYISVLEFDIDSEHRVFTFEDEFFWRCNIANRIEIKIAASTLLERKTDRTDSRNFSIRSHHGGNRRNFEFSFNRSDFEGLPNIWLSDAIGNIKYYRFDPLKLRKPSPLKKTMDETGEGFVAFLDKINREAPDAYSSLRQEFREKFPYYQDLSLPLSEHVKGDGIELKFHTINNETLSADSVSDGVMLSLAFIALNYQPNPPKILLIEEPENGVHHGSLEQIVKTLRSLAEEKKVQIIMTTHSPHLVDCVEPDEVHVFHKDDDGAVYTKKLTCYPDLENLKKHFRAGEIWTGFKEADLFKKQGAAK